MLLRVRQETRLQKKLREVKAQEIAVLQQCGVEETLEKLVYKVMKMFQKQIEASLQADGTGFKTQLVQNPITKEPQLNVIFPKPLPSLSNPSLLEACLSLNPDSDFDPQAVQKAITARESLADQNACRKLYRAFVDHHQLSGCSDDITLQL